METLEKRFVEINAKINLRWNEYLEKHPFEGDSALKISFLKDAQYQELAKEKISILKEMQAITKENNYCELEEDIEMV